MQGGRCWWIGVVDNGWRETIRIGARRALRCCPRGRSLYLDLYGINTEGRASTKTRTPSKAGPRLRSSMTSNGKFFPLSLDFRQRSSCSCSTPTATPGSTRGLLPLLRVRNYRWGTRGHRIFGLRKSVPRHATYDDWNWDILVPKLERATR